jgi:hypothetical protein
MGVEGKIFRKLIAEDAVTQMYKYKLIHLNQQRSNTAI